MALLSLSHSSCFTDDTAEPYYGRSVPPRSQEFRWSDGGLPQVFDPAFAAAPPDTDLIRAIFEGLTEYDPRTLQAVPAVATRWESSKDGKVWTFYLRENARWSNGEPVTAHDFVQSWERTVRLGDLAPHTELLRNIEGAAFASMRSVQPIKPDDRSVATVDDPSRNSPAGKAQRLGAEAVDELVLRVRLERPDPNFPALVAHPVFRPVKVNAESLSKIGPSDLVSNGAFLLAQRKDDRVLLARAENYWGKEDVSLERVAFVDSKNAENALAAYRDGEVDAVTNAAFEPLAIKLLAPYEDFRRATYGALTYYSFNTEHAPFDDVRVREALAIAIDRERISHGELGGATEPAKKFLPDGMTESNNPVVGKSDLLEKDVVRARELLAEAGFPDGKGFPKIRLLINRNEQQRLVSQSIASMWRSSLNIETEIVMKNWDEYEAAIRAGEFDIVRRGLVMQTTDELTNMRMMFRQESPSVPAGEGRFKAAGEADQTRKGAEQSVALADPIESEEQALRQLKAVPIYFASSYALVKPYVFGFDSNVLDAPSLKRVKIDTVWSEPKKR
jgi:oligopeptide transport system substrate-binding protein